MERERCSVNKNTKSVTSCKLFVDSFIFQIVFFTQYIHTLMPMRRFDRQIKLVNATKFHLKCHIALCQE